MESEVLKKIQKIYNEYNITPDNIRETNDGYEVDWYNVSFFKGNSFKEYLNPGTIADAMSFVKNLFEKWKFIDEVEIELSRNYFNKNLKKTCKKWINLFFMNSKNEIYISSMDITLINLTPHDVNIVDNNGDVILVVPVCDKPLKLIEKRDVIGDINGIPLSRVSYEVDEATPVPLPEVNKKNTFYIVSRVVAETIKRSDFIVPDQTVRNDKGQIVGCKGFAFV